MTQPNLISDLPKLWDDPRLRNYLGEVNRRHGVVDTLALPNMRDLPPIRIESLFVQPLLSQSAVSPISAPETWPEGLSLFSTLQSSPCLVLLGDPGSGKTTLVNWLAWRLSGGFTKPLPSLLEDRLPIPCVLREMKSMAFADGITVADLAIMVAERLLEKKVNAALKASLRAHVEAKQYVLILDGVDEIPHAQRNTVAVWMQQAKRDGACALATSRIVGYEDYPICRSSVQVGFSRKDATKRDEIIYVDDEFEDISTGIAIHELNTPAQLFEVKIRRDTKQEKFFLKEYSWAETRYLMPFDQKRITAFVENWYLQRSASEQDATEKTESLIYALSQSETTQELARTPNLLSLMAIVHRERAHLPDGKALLYKEIANAYINTIDQHRNITVDKNLAHFDWEVREGWIAFVGFQMQLERNSVIPDDSSSDRHKTGVLVSEEKVLTWLTLAMEESGVSEAQLSAQVFLQWVARRSGLLLPRGEGLFAFVHLSFQEYFCARYLVSRIISPKFIKDKLEYDAPVTKEKLKKWSCQALWRENLIYVLELVSAERDPDWVEDLIEILFDSIENDKDFDSDSAGLAVRILTNRHIRLSSTWKKILARRSSSVAFAYWRFNLGDDSLIRALIRTKYAAIYASVASATDSRYIDLPIRELSQLHEIHTEMDLCILILEDEKIQDISVVAKLRSLSELSIKSKSLKDISALAGLSGLKTVNLSGTKIQDISAMRGMSRLEALELDGTLVQNISSLSTLKNLESLNLHGTKVEDISPLRKLNNLRTLNLTDTKVSDISSLEGMKHLHALFLSNTRVQDISALAKLNNLSYLKLSKTKVQDISPLSRLTSLYALFLNNTKLKNIAALEGMTKLMRLDLSSTQIKNVSALTGLKNLRTLYLSDTPIRDISALSALKDLYVLDLKGTQVEDVSPLNGMATLSNLDLSGSQVRDISILSTIKYLSEVYLNDTQVQDISPLAKLKGLQEVRLKGTQVQDFSFLHDFDRDDNYVFSRKVRGLLQARR